MKLHSDSNSDLYTFHDHYKLSRSLCVLLHGKKNIEIDRLCLFQFNYFPIKLGPLYEN
jgi:hypothetical protein